MPYSSADQKKKLLWGNKAPASTEGSLPVSFIILEVYLTSLSLKDAQDMQCCSHSSDLLQAVIESLTCTILYRTLVVSSTVAQHRHLEPCDPAIYGVLISRRRGAHSERIVGTKPSSGTRLIARSSSN